MSNNRDFLLSMVLNRDVNKSPVPLVYDLSIYGGIHIIITNHYRTESELRTLAEQDRQEWEEDQRRFREKYPSIAV